MPTMSSSASHDAYNTLISLLEKLARLNGVITPEAVDKLEDELGGIFTVTKTHHCKQGQKYGHLASAIPESKYRIVIGNAAWTHMPDSDEMANSHLKGQRQGIRSTKHNAFTALVEQGETRIKIEGESSPYKLLPPTKLNDIFIRVVDLTNEIHTNQTVAFPHTSQQV